MANMLDNGAVRSIAKHRNKLMSLVESTKKRKKKKQKKWAVPPSNIEHLVFKKIPTSPIDPGPHFNGTRLDFSDDNAADDYDGEEPEEESCDELDEVMVEERCSMSSSAVDATEHAPSHATLSFHLKTSHKTCDISPPRKDYKNRVIVVSGEDSGFTAAAEAGGTCTTTTTFKSNVINGKRSTNTILVRYKPGKAISPSSEDELQIEFNNSKNDGISVVNSSSLSTVSPDSASNKVEKTSTSAWAQIMELEGYRSPAIGLDNVGIKQDDKNRTSSGDDSNFSSLSGEAYNSDLSFDKYVGNSSDEVFSVDCYSSIPFQDFSKNGKTEATCVYFKNYECENDSLDSDKESLSVISDSTRSSIIDSSVSYHPNAHLINTLNPKQESGKSVPNRPKSSLQYHFGEGVMNESQRNSFSSDQTKVVPKPKSAMLRSESSRISKSQTQERNKSRRKTLPDGNLYPNACSIKSQGSDAITQKSPEHDPNASWGRYNSRAMRDSVRKYAETLYLRRQTRVKLDSLPEAKGVKLTRYVSASGNQDHVHSLKGLYLRNNLYSSRTRAISTSHLHDCPPEPVSSFPSHCKFNLPSASSMNAKRREYRSTLHLDQHFEENARKSPNSSDSQLSQAYLSSDSFKQVSDANLPDKVNKYVEVISCKETPIVNGYEVIDKNSDEILSDHIYQNCLSDHLKSTKIALSVESDVAAVDINDLQLSVNMNEIKSKLCSDCAQSAELGPPHKQPASRTRHQHFKSSQHIHYTDANSLKNASLATCDGDKSLCLFHRSFTEPETKIQRKPITTSDENEKCTKLTAREMTELVHGKIAGNSTDSKIQTGVTSKVSNWIQKQKDKRKPVFFIGDGPVFEAENVSQTDSKSKSKNRKSRRSLSLTSVRESEISTNSNGRTDSPLHFLHLNSSENSDDLSSKHNEQKGLFIKRTSSCCSNKESTGRKSRQGSLVRQEKENTKYPDHGRNQVDENVGSFFHDRWDKFSNEFRKPKASLEIQSNLENNKIRTTGTESKTSSFLKNIPAEKRSKYLSEHNFIPKSYHSNDHITEECIKKSYGLNSLNDNQNQLQNSNQTTFRNDRLNKKILSIKQLTRALSLHSLKKKTKDEPCDSQVVVKPTTNLVKWSRGSKRKIENMKFGSLRKSLSYCELTARETKIPDKTPLQEKLELHSKNSVRSTPARVISRKVSCACSTSLRRTVSLSWQFPLSRKTATNFESAHDNALAKLCFLRLHCKNSSLPFVRNLRKKDSETFNSSEKPRINSDSSQKLCAEMAVPTLKPEKKVQTDQNKPGVPESALNGDQESFSNSTTMGLGNNPVLDELDSKNEQNMVEEFISFENSSLNSQNKSSSFMNKNKTSSILRLRNKNISRAERSSKGKSTSEVYDKILRKNEKSVELKKRPKSQFYDIDEIETSIGEKNLIEQSCVDSISHPALNNIDQLSELSEPSCALNSRNSSLHTSITQLSPPDSLLRKFRKSFAVRFKKRTDSVSSNLNKSHRQSPISSQEPIPNFQSYLQNSNSKEEEKEEVTNEIPEKSSVEPLNTCDIDVPQTDLHKKINFSEHSKKQSANISNSRVRGKRKQDWRRSLFYDSVDNIFDSNKSSVNKSYKTPQFAGSDANILRKRTASTSDYSPKFKDIQQPLSTVDSSSPETNCTKLSDHKNEVTPNANSNAVNLEDHQKTITSLDQIWRSNPVKLCRVHSRLLMCRHKGRYRLRRSISQPVELEMSGSMHSLKESTHGSAEHETFQKSSLSSDDEVSSESDIYHSYCCSPTRRSNTCWELSGESAMYAEALWDHETIDTEELPFQAGDILEVTDTSDQDWWWGIKDGQGGWFPSAFVRLYVSHRGPALHYNGQTTEELPYSPSKVSMNNLSWEQVRANIVQEIVATERDYVKHLKDVVEGYLKQVQRRPDMFSKERIETVFGNIQEIYNFQSEFLKQVENCLDNDAPHLSQIGNCFLNHKEEFKMYSQYCNNHPLAVSELQELYCDSQYIHFFEACRLLQEMIDISLDGFLLTPIQRICKYPLQLAELLKFTDENHPDHIPVTNAFAAMKEVAELVNERKRRMECLERIAEWQNTIEGWEGPDVLDTSSILIHCGEVTRVSSSWSRDIYLFIFDHQLIYCKKDLLKRHTYAYKGRLNLDHCDIVDVDDGKDSHFAVTVKNAWKIYCRDKDKWYLFYAKTAPEKEQWIRAFKSERQRVNDDEKQAFVVTEEAKRSARLAVHNKQKPKRPRAKFAKGRRCHPDVAVTELLLDSPSAKARSGSLPSNIHPELAIMTGAKLGPTRKKGSGWFHFGSGKKPKS